MNKIEAALTYLADVWEWKREYIRAVKGDDRVLFYRRWNNEWWPLPEACMQQDPVDPSMCKLVFCDFSGQTKYAHGARTCFTSHYL